MFHKTRASVEYFIVSILFCCELQFPICMGISSFSEACHIEGTRESYWMLRAPQPKLFFFFFCL